MHKKLDAIIQEYLSHAGPAPVHNILVYLQDERKGLLYHKGFGLADGRNRKAAKDDQFKIASITKMCTAVLVLQLVEEGLIDIDWPVHRYVQEIAYLDFETLHIYDGVSYGREITVRQLLNHGSGLADLFTDGEGQFMEYVLQNPERSYNPQMLFALFYQFGLNRSSVAPPGHCFHYSDTGYFLLGLLVEQVTGCSLAQQYRTRIFEPLGMKSSFFEYYEVWDQPVSMAHSFYDKVDVTATVNTSYDWAGGGIVSTTAELAQFIQGLFQGQLFKEPDTLQRMMEHPNESYALGLKVSDSFYGHFSFWGGTLAYSPEQKITLCVSINQVNPPFNRMEMIERILNAMQRADGQ